MDYLAIVTPLAGGFIRLGNLMNSEIVGAPTNVPWAMIFTRFDDIPRHPAQLYEALSILPFCGIVDSLSQKLSVKDGFYLSVVMVVICLFAFYRICKRGADAVRKSNDSQYVTMAKYSVYCGR